MERTFLKRIFRILFLALLLAGILYGRLQQPENEVPPPTFSRTVRIGIIPEQDVFSQKNRYQPLADYIGRRLGVKVELVMLSRYGNIIDNFMDRRLDGAFFGSFTGAMAVKSLGVIPLARPESREGTSTYYGMIFVRKDSGIKNGADMRGKRFVFVDKATTAGYLLPLHYFQEQGIVAYRSWFSETYFAGTHEDAIYDVLNKRADVGAAKNTVFERFAINDRRLHDELNILTTSPQVPENALALKNDFDPRLLASFKKCLLEMDKDSAGRAVLFTFGARRFIETTAADYQPVFDFAALIGLDLATYRYNND